MVEKGMFDGHWILDNDNIEPTLKVQQWMLAITVTGSTVIDGEGKVRFLRVKNGQASLEGGRLFLADGKLHRQGKTNVICSFVRATLA